MSNSLDPDQAGRLLGLIWAQTVCKGYQQMTLAGKELGGPGPKVIKLFYAQMNMKFQLLIKNIMLKNKGIWCLKLSDIAYIMLIND